MAPFLLPEYGARWILGPMCGRVAIRVLKKAFRERFGAGRIELDAIFPKANVAPTDFVPGVRLDAGERVASPYLFGFLPPNAPDRRFISKYSTFNAVGETLLEKRLWPRPFATRRCLVVVDAWFEWQKVPGSTKKLPKTILPATGEPLAMAGLWGPWRDPATGETLDTATIITTAANGALQEVHHRMPVVLGESDWSAWLGPETAAGDLLSMLRPCPDEWLTIRAGGPETFLLEP